MNQKQNKKPEEFSDVDENKEVKPQVSRGLTSDKDKNEKDNKLLFVLLAFY